MKSLVIALSIVALFAASALDSLAQVSVTSGIYTQNFDGLAVTGTNQPWVNNLTLPGWYGYQDTNTTDGPVTTLYPPTSSSSGLAWHGSAPDYALGSGYNISTGSLSFGVRLINDTGASVDSFSVGFIGEQWRRGSNSEQATDSLAFSYQIFDTGTGSMAAQNWISASSLDFISPNATATNLANLNGNAPENRVSYSSWIAGITLDEGQELWLRWTATDNPSFSDHGLAIDDLIVTFGAIPEPSAYAAIVSGWTLFAVGLRRRGRKNA